MKAMTRNVVVAAVLAGAWLPMVPAAPITAPAADETAWLGIVLGDAIDGGVQVVAVVPGGPADRGGVRAGDVLLAFGDRSTPDRTALLDVMRVLPAGQDVLVRLVRDGRIARAALRPIESRRRGYPLLDFRFSEPGESARVPLAGFETARIPRELRLHYGAPPEAGVLVVRVDAEGSAARAGIKVGDVVVKVAGRPVDEPYDLARSLARPNDGKLVVDLVRARKAMTVRFASSGPAPAIRDGERKRLEEEQQRLRLELDRVEAEIEELRKLER